MFRLAVVLVGFSLSAFGAPEGLERFRGDWVPDSCARQVSEGRDCPNPFYVQHTMRDQKEGLDLLTYEGDKRDGMWTAFDRADFTSFGFFPTCAWVGTLRICHHTKQPAPAKLVHYRSLKTLGVLGSGDKQTVELSKTQSCTPTAVDRLTYTYELDGEVVQRCVYVRP